MPTLLEFAIQLRRREMHWMPLGFMVARMWLGAELAEAANDGRT